VQIKPLNQAVAAQLVLCKRLTWTEKLSVVSLIWHTAHVTKQKKQKIQKEETKTHDAVRLFLVKCARPRLS